MNHDHDHGMSGKHLWIMVLCCLIPVAAFVAISFFKVPLSGVFYIGLILLCPLSHLILMRVFKGQRKSVEESNQDG